METDSMTLYRLLTEVFILLDDIDQRTLRLHNLSIRQFNILYHLGQGQEMNINELSRHLLCDKSNTTRLVERMKQEGLLSRERDPKDRRYVSVRLTEEGINLRERVVASHQHSVKERFKELSSQEEATLNQLLRLLRDSLRQYINQM